MTLVSERLSSVKERPTFKTEYRFRVEFLCRNGWTDNS